MIAVAEETTLITGWTAEGIIAVTVADLLNTGVSMNTTAGAACTAPVETAHEDEITGKITAVEITAVEICVASIEAKCAEETTAKVRRKK